MMKSAEEIRRLRKEDGALRERDFAAKYGIREAQLVAANCGHGVTRIKPHPDKIVAAAEMLGEVMALTRNDSCVNEKVGYYGNYHSGQHACIVFNKEIDLRIFPAHWHSAFMVEKQTDQGKRCSLQVFDAAGDAVHKIFLRNKSDLAAWSSVQVGLALDNQDPDQPVAARKPIEAPKIALDKLDILRKEWAAMTDTHQFMRLTSKLKMNRLGAYRAVGAPFARPLPAAAFDQMLQNAQAQELGIMVFTGNRGCIQIHSGPIRKLKSMGPWQNVLDPGFNLHLRLDQIAEVWAVSKPTKTGPAVSVEAFDADGGLISQVFGVGTEGDNCRPAWNAMVEALPTQEREVA
ncbi:MAG: hemin-degrading factor [Rhodobacteraceae bacterium]|nr:hemin-degrading factor [Paracoccaceae bacterium]